MSPLQPDSGAWGGPPGGDGPAVQGPVLIQNKKTVPPEPWAGIIPGPAVAFHTRSSLFDGCAALLCRTMARKERDSRIDVSNHTTRRGKRQSVFWRSFTGRRWIRRGSMYEKRRRKILCKDLPSHNHGMDRSEEGRAVISAAGTAGWSSSAFRPGRGALRRRRPIPERCRRWSGPPQRYAPCPR